MVLRSGAADGPGSNLLELYLAMLALDPQAAAAAAAARGNPGAGAQQQAQNAWFEPDRLELGTSLSPELKEMFARQLGTDPSELDLGEILKLLIDYLANDMQERNKAGAPPPRAAGNMNGGQRWGAPQPASWGGSGSGSGSGTTTPSAPVTATPSLPPGQGLEGLKIQVIGDSLMVGAGDATKRALTAAGASNVNVDAQSGRAITGSGEGKHMSPAEIRQSAEASGANVVVVELGSNHADYAKFIPETMNELSKIQPPPMVVWVNTQTQRPGNSAYDNSYFAGNADINRVIAEEASKRPNMVVADWSKIGGGAGINGGDGLHLTGAGNDAMAKLILETIAGARS